jgi:hypothetical protein
LGPPFGKLFPVDVALPVIVVAGQDGVGMVCADKVRKNQAANDQAAEYYRENYLSHEITSRDKSCRD